MSDGAAFCERHVWSMYGMFESVSQMLEQLSWIPLSKIRKNSRQIINNLAVVPHSCLENADVRNRKTFSSSQQYRHIGYAYRIYPYGQFFSSNSRLAPMWQQSGTLLFDSCHVIAGFLVDDLQI